MRILIASVLGLLFLATVAASARLLLPACGVHAANLFYCPAPAILEAEARLAALDAGNATLVREVAALERELGAVQCTAVYPEPEPPRAPLPEPPARAEVPAPHEIDPEAWARRDLRVLDGCWRLDSTYRTRNERTGEVTTFDQWRMCFDSAGNGRAEMRATNGVACSGAVAGVFDANGALTVNEAANLACSNQTYIYRRDLRCQLLPDGAAECSVNQPSVRSTTTVRLRRETGDQ